MVRNQPVRAKARQPHHPHRLLRLFILLGTVCATVPAAAEEPHISWRVENPFRFFADPADTAVHRATYLALSPKERTNPVLSAERALAARHDSGWAATMFRETCWDSKINRHVCPGGSDYVTPRAHAVIAWIDGVEDAALVECLWLTSPHGGRNPRGDAIRQPCREPVRFEVPWPRGSAVSVEIGGRTVAQTTIAVRDLLIAGMGDSFGSGEGNPDLPVRFSRERSMNYGADLAGYPARTGPWQEIGDREFFKENALWLDQACHRSLYSHQLRAALQLSLEDPHRAVTFVGVACAGAEIIRGLFQRYEGNEWVPNPPDLSQISAVAQAQCGRKDAPFEDLPAAYGVGGSASLLGGRISVKRCPVTDARPIDLLFLSIGGNDIGFARLLANAVLHDESVLKTFGGWFGQVMTGEEALRQLRDLDARYKALNRALHNVLHIPWDESERIVLTAYPGMALLGDGSRVCPDGQAGLEVMPEFEINEQKVREGVRVADQLHNQMETSAAKYGWTFVARHRQAFIGRGICAGFTDNAFSIADDLRIPRRTGKRWQPYNPADYRPYAPRQRWFRTPNDAFLTANLHGEPTLIEKALKLESFSWVQLLLAATYSGAFHPTAEGQAAIAGEVAAAARRILERYAPGTPQVAGTPGADETPTGPFGSRETFALPESPFPDGRAKAE